MTNNSQSRPELEGFIYGFIGVLVFSLTLPATRMAITGFDPIFVGLGRAIFAAVLSFMLVLIFAWQSGTGSLRLADLALVGAVVAAGLGYAEGAVLARTFGAWQVICWSLILSTPILLPIVIPHLPTDSVAWRGWGRFN